MKKVFLISIIFILFLTFGTIEVNAMFSLSTGEDKTDGEEAYIEVLASSEDGKMWTETVVKSPKIYEDKGDSENYGEIRKYDTLWLHIYYEEYDVVGGVGVHLKDDNDEHISSEEFGFIYYDRNGNANRVRKGDDGVFGNDSIETIVGITPKKETSTKCTVCIVDEDGYKLKFTVNFSKILPSIDEQIQQHVTDILENKYNDPEVLNNNNPEDILTYYASAMYVEGDNGINMKKGAEVVAQNLMNTELSKIESIENLLQTATVKKIFDSITNAKDKDLEKYLTEWEEYKSKLLIVFDKAVEYHNATEENKSIAENQLVSAAKDAGKTIEKVNEKMLTIMETLKGIGRTEVNFTDVLENIGDYIDDVKDYVQDTTKLEGMISTVLTVISNLGIIVAVLMPAIVGVKYMVGSIEEKAEYKKDMLPYLVGAMLLFGISTVIKILQGIGNSIND